MNSRAMNLHPFALLALACCTALIQGCASPSQGAPSAPSATQPSSQVLEALSPTGAGKAATTARPVLVADATPVQPNRESLDSNGIAPAPAATAAAVMAVDTLQPDARYETDTAAEQQDLWARLRKGYAIPDLDGDLVRKWEQFYAKKPEYMQRMTERGGRYLFHVVEEIEKRGMPTDLALLPFIESAFNPQAMSTARASGMWQFIPSTGKDFALRQNLFRDDRRDVLASTRAALDYLQRLHKMFGDWQLALAAYNWGQGSVGRAMERNRKAGLETNYVSLNMPDETRNYVPKLQAIKNLVLQPQHHGLKLPELKNHPYFLSVKIDRDIDVALATRLAGLPLAEFQTLNPQMNKPVILASGTPQVLLPFDNAKTFVRNLNQHQGALATWTAWVAPKTMKSAEAARLVGMDEGKMREINHIPPRMLVKVGSTLLVPRTARRDVDVSPTLADNAMLALAPDLPPMRKVVFRAGKRGETVAAVAKRYRTTPAQVAQWNRVGAQGKFAPGQQVVVMVPNKRAVAASGKAAARGAKVARTGAKGGAKGRANVMATKGGRGQKVGARGPATRVASARRARG
jgi:membrane-bound lytic murein transglycosylase D